MLRRSTNNRSYPSSYKTARKDANSANKQIVNSFEETADLEELARRSFAF